MTKEIENNILKNLNPHKNDVVRIKFKSFNQILSETKRDFQDAEEFYEFGRNVKAFLKGGDFIVADRFEENGEYSNITIKNHLDSNYTFVIYAETIESIEVVQDSERFVSHDHGIMVVRVEDEMYINGEPLIWNESDRKKEHESNRRKNDEAPYINENRRLLKMFENFLADLAVRESFKQEGDE